MAPTQNSTLINLINDDIKSITSERLSPISVQEESSDNSDNEVCIVTEILFEIFYSLDLGKAFWHKFDPF